MSWNNKLVIKEYEIFGEQCFVAGIVEVFYDKDGTVGWTDFIHQSSECDTKEAAIEELKFELNRWLSVIDSGEIFSTGEPVQVINKKTITGEIETIEVTEDFIHNSIKDDLYMEERYNEDDNSGC